ncbi:galactoside alpha-(1,2)-fucosyltransferase 1-like isoform X2 [Penaeus chinensis]|uniref:galactoside alpha-(1,2)-fucosyltransferase 1-like isoform X2 n=1 Tax=Penaeus chinensis TaxID=139456 RepID=UPI001FB6DFCE|nr:galactoside alpha-(1,2)-fucosyltransferase 1-like isoform X2 [Penaeus chinensis]
MCRNLLPMKAFLCALMLASGGYLFLNDILRLRTAVFPVAGGLTAPVLRLSEDERSDLAPVTLVPNAAPATFIPPSKRVRYANLSWHGYPLPVLTCQSKGRLGNLMGEYATLWGLRRTYNVTVLVSPRMKTGLIMFPALSLPTLEAPAAPPTAPGPSRIQWRRVGRSGGSLYNFSLVEAASAGLLGPHHFKIQNSPFEMQLFGRFKEDLRREFAFSKGIRDQNLFHGELPGVSYFERAMDYYREKFADGVAFIAASDDPRFIIATLSHNPDVYFAPGRSPELDLAVLVSCNHSIITMGSFGFWSGFLAGGEVVYPDTRFRRTYRFARRMYEVAHLDNFTPLPV